eukprot:6688250-Prymnesium_polylepis.1
MGASLLPPHALAQLSPAARCLFCTSPSHTRFAQTHPPTSHPAKPPSPRRVAGPPPCRTTTSVGGATSPE